MLSAKEVREFRERAAKKLDDLGIQDQQGFISMEKLTQKWELMAVVDAIDFILEEGEDSLQEDGDEQA